MNATARPPTSPAAPASSVLSASAPQSFVLAAVSRMGRMPRGLAGAAPGPQGLHSRWVVVPVTVLVWLGAGASVAHWGLRAWGQGPTTPVPVASVTAMAVDTQAVARALGAQAMVVQPTAMDAPVQADVASRYAVLGVVAPAGTGSSGSGVALIAVEGQRPMPYRVGAVLDERWVVRSVGRSTVELAALGTPAASAASASAGLTLAVPQPTVAASSP